MNNAGDPGIPPVTYIMIDMVYANNSMRYLIRGINSTRHVCGCLYFFINNIREDVSLMLANFETMKHVKALIDLLQVQTRKSGSEMPITQNHLWIISSDTRFGLQMWIMNNLYLVLKGCMIVTNIFMSLLQKSSFEIEGSSILNITYMKWHLFQYMSFAMSW